MRRSYLITFVVFMALVYGYIFWMSPRRQPNLPLEQVQWIEVSFHDQLGKQTQQALSRDTAKNRGLLEVLQRGEPTGDHKCGDSGSIKLQLHAGGQLELGLLAGHHEPFYEFRLYRNGSSGYDMYRVDRPALLAALADLGITKVDLGAPE